MRVASTVCKFLMWMTLGITTLMQGLVIFGISGNNARALEVSQPGKVYSILPLVVAMALLWAAAIVFAALKKHRYIGVIVGTVAAVALLVIALDLKRAFPVQISASGMDTGIDTWKLLYRHISPLLVTVFMIPAFFCGRVAEKAEEKWQETNGKAHFDLSGSAVFQDESTIGVTLPADEELSSARKREKRSIKKRKEKETP